MTPQTNTTMAGFGINILPCSKGALERPDIVRPATPALGAGRFAYLKEGQQLRSSQQSQWQSLKGIHSGQRAFILGNAPSIRTLDLAKVQPEVNIAVNSTFRLYDELGWISPYTCFSDRVRWVETGSTALAASPGSQFFYADDWEIPTPHSLFTEKELSRILLLDRGHRLPLSIYRWMFLGNRAGLAFTKFLRSRKFNPDITQGVCLGNSVIFLAAQLAAFLGCNPIILLGVDMDYSGPQKHFHGGKVWTPEMDYEQDAKPWFLLFRREMERLGIEFLNASPAGKVDCLRRVRYDSLF